MKHVLDLRAEGISRRTFLIAGAAAGGGLMIGWAPSAEAAATGVFAPDAFIRLDPAGKVTVVMPVIEMGQGT